ncbi:MAG: MmcQ/YjbR family DNA-binding protein [Phycisphaerae bacterium]|nr:MmcQ/YjbR family DNA-binding protein [Phycisphaerae bacterium]
MKPATLRRFALALEGTVEKPHHEMTSFRARGRIYATMPPAETHVHVFVDEALREETLARGEAYTEKLRWGSKVVGLRITLDDAPAIVVKRLVRAAWARER